MSIHLTTKVWERGPEDRTETIVLLALADFADDSGGSCYPSIATIAERARLSERGAQNVLKRLDEKDWISIERGGGRGNSNNYQINVDKLARKTPKQVQGSEEENPEADTIKGEADTIKGEADTRKGEADTRNPEADTIKGEEAFRGNRQGTTKENQIPNHQGDGAPARAPARGDGEATSTDPEIQGTQGRLSSHPAVEAHDEVFPAVSLSHLQQEKIVKAVEDVEVWEEVLEWWAMNDYRARSIGNQLQKYRERIRHGKQNRGSNRTANADNGRPGRWGNYR